MYERRHERLLPRAAFIRRLGNHVIGGVAIILVSLLGGVVGYHVIGGLPWVDALLNASMILGGMGPVDALHTTGAKIFASVYALFSGVVFLVVVGLILAPVLHRLLHRFHLDPKVKE